MGKLRRDLIFSIIGILIMFLGFLLPPFAGISKAGVIIIFIFAGALLLWTFVSGDWASILALVLIGLSGYYGAGAAGFKAALVSALGNDTVLTIMFLSILFGGLQMSGALSYLVKWFLSRKIVAGHPYVILAFIGGLSFLVSGVSTNMVALIVMWAIVQNICSISSIGRKEPIWVYMFGIVLLGASVGTAILPFQGVGIAMMSVYNNIGGDYPISTTGYLILTVLMGILLMAVFLVLTKFIFRPDVSKLKCLTCETLNATYTQPPMSKAQKLYLAVLPLYLLMVVVPSFGTLGQLPILNLLNEMGALGIAFAWMVVLMLVRFDGTPVLNFREVASRQVPWSVVLMVAIGIAVSQVFGDAEVGIMNAIQNVLRPLLAGKPTLLVVLILMVTGVIITNFAANAAMAFVLTPIAVACATELGLNPAPIALCVMMIVFVALLTPAASPATAMCYAEDRYYTAKEIRSWALVISILAIVLYTVVGYPLSTFFVHF